MVQIACLPWGDFSQSERRLLHLRAWNTFEAYASKALNIAVEGLTVRDAILGDTSSTDWYDLKTKTSTTAGQEYWNQAAADISAANDLLAQLDTTYTLPTGTALAFYGFVDLSTVRDLEGLRVNRGAESLLFVEPEKCYGDPNAPDGGFFVLTQPEDGLTAAPLTFKANDQPQLYMAFKASGAVRNVVMLAIVAESAGKRMKGVSEALCARSVA